MDTCLEGTYSEVCPDISQDEAGLKRRFKPFSFPGGIPSHASPECPGSMHEDDEPGYSLSHSFGAVFDASGRLNAELADLAPRGLRRMGANSHASGGLSLRDLRMPDFRDYAVDVQKPGLPGIGDTHVLGPCLRDVVKLNSEQRHVRVFGPDATLSNGLEALFEVTQRQWGVAMVAGKHATPQWLSMNVVDLMGMQPPLEHPHDLSDRDFDELFSRDKPVICSFHAYPWLNHRLTYRRTNHHNIHVRGYKEEGTITTPFDMTVLNELVAFRNESRL